MANVAATAAWVALCELRSAFCLGVHSTVHVTRTRIQGRKLAHKVPRAAVISAVTAAIRAESSYRIVCAKRANNCAFRALRMNVNMKDKRAIG
jgi:hypothetical protein